MEYRNVVRRKKREFNKYRLAKLNFEDQTASSPSVFWKKFRIRAAGLGKEHEDGLVQHCKKLYEQSDVAIEGGEGPEAQQNGGTDRSAGPVVQRESGAGKIEGLISEEEVREALGKMRNGKSADAEGFTAELLKEGGVELVGALTAVFKRVFEAGRLTLRIGIPECSSQSRRKGTRLTTIITERSRY